jgi:hypothetical protein
LGPTEVRMKMQGAKVVFDAKAMMNAVCSSDIHAVDDLSPAQALALGQVLGSLGVHNLQFGASAALPLTQAVGALHVLLEGSPADIQQGFYRHWLPGQALAEPMPPPPEDEQEDG